MIEPVIVSHIESPARFYVQLKGAKQQLSKYKILFSNVEEDPELRLGDLTSGNF